MPSKRKTLRKIQLGILPASVLTGVTPEPTVVEETITATPVRTQVEAAIEAFREDNPILPEAELTTTKNTRTRRARKPTAKKTTKTKKSS
jgi:hypothetical protein